MPDPGKAVFLSYAREDSDVVGRIAEALRTAGVEVWFDQSELRGGDAWDQKIRRQVKECALFVPVVSTNTQARLEGYFRREWNWAAERTHDMAHDLAFLVPVAIDGTKENLARVPEEFLKMQWTRLPGRTEQELQTFAGRVRQLLDGAKDAAGGTLTPGDDRSRVRAPELQPASKSRSMASAAAALILLGSGIAFWLTRTRNSDLPAPSADAAAVPAASVAVLAFENLSEDKGNEYFAEGMSDELLNVLQKIPGLRVTARMSAFSFKGQKTTAQEIGRKLGVAYLVNGSVQKSGTLVRLVVRLDRADTGEQVWGDSFQRELKDIFAVQSELAVTIISQLRSRLGGGSTAADTVQAEVAAATRGGTKNTAAHEAYLQGRYHADRMNGEDLARAVGYFQRAVELDEKYAASWAALGAAELTVVNYGFENVAPTVDRLDAAIRQARSRIDRSLALVSDLPEGLLARAGILNDFDWKGSAIAVNRAFALAPQNAQVVAAVAGILNNLGRSTEALRFMRNAVSLDPVNPSFYLNLMNLYGRNGQYEDARQSYLRAIELSPDIVWGRAGWAVFLALQGNGGEALVEAGKEKVEWTRLTALAMAHWQLQDRAASDAALDRLIATTAEFAAYQIAEIYAFRGQGDEAFQWLERAFRQRDGGIAYVRVDPVWSRIRDDPRWPVFLRKVGLADEQVKEWGW